MLNVDIYRTAERMCVLVNNDAERHYFAEFNRNYLYRDLRDAQREHYRMQDGQRRQREWELGEAQRTAERNRREADEANRVLSAAVKAARLLQEVVSPAFAEGIKKSSPFYHRTTNHQYIIDPEHKNVIRLDEKHPVGLCIYFADPAVQRNTSDWGIAVYLYLQGAEEQLHRTANEYRYLRHANWTKEYPLDPSAGALNIY